jgi:hypothetical protein
VIPQAESEGREGILRRQRGKRNGGAITRPAVTTILPD